MGYAGRSAPSPPTRSTIEQILSQNPDLSSAWYEALGPDWAQLQEEWLHRLGNLTLTGYNPELSDRPQLVNPQIRAMFDLLEARIRALDLNVSQEVLKLTIACKAETNVVVIVPKAKRLLLSLNMPFAELDDPNGIAKNVAGVGRWGNGEVEFGVASMEEIPYAIGLIRQSLERKMEGES